jgi:hypothetical protein
LSDELTTVSLQHMIGTQSTRLAGGVTWRQGQSLLRAGDAALAARQRRAVAAAGRKRGSLQEWEGQVRYVPL